MLHFNLIYRYSAYHAKNPKWIADTTHPESEEWTGTRSTYISAVKATQVYPPTVSE